MLKEIKELHEDCSLPVKATAAIMFMNPCSKNYRYIVCAKNDLTGVVEASPLINNNSKELTKFF